MMIRILNKRMRWCTAATVRVMDPRRTDPRLRAAIETSRRWYDDVVALHDIPSMVDDALWIALATPPPWHSAVKTLGPSASPEQVLAAMEQHPSGSVADSFGTLDLASAGFELIIEASWLVHPAPPSSGWPEQWTVVREPVMLTEWARLHDYVGVLPPSVLEHPRFHVLAKVRGGEVVAGAVIHDAESTDAESTVGHSNLWATDGLGQADVAAVLACAGTLYPGRPVADYAWGEELALMISAGFKPVGPHHIWAR